MQRCIKRRKLICSKAQAPNFQYVKARLLLRPHFSEILARKCRNLMLPDVVPRCLNCVKIRHLLGLRPRPHWGSSQRSQLLLKGGKVGEGRTGGKGNCRVYTGAIKRLLCTGQLLVHRALIVVLFHSECFYILLSHFHCIM